ncbi:RICIN domain-containing protein [Nocardiopsis sp. HNM0947]|uniref:RICIN domain-containing protein n=1 Tax=Nocardiopsis coralli TaxID=2772213 RepID=A0ABR9P777_9ACTN|nr:RICIN domain-containing protein [Nocardiopsis coralli]MBE2999688.1 RICIN domain-containing protein [Nocardiopsis coralli]
MSSSRPRPDDDAEEGRVPRWPMVAGALALLLGVTVAGYTAGAAVNELEAVEEEELEVSSGILVDPPGGPEEDEEAEEEPEPGPLPEGVEPGATQVLQNVHGDRVMDVAGGSTDSGAHIHLWDRHDEENQQWRLHPVDDTHVEIEGVESGLLLEIAEAEDNPGAVLKERDGEPRQHWIVVQMQDGAVRLVNRETRNALEAEGGDPENRSLVVEAADAGQPHQQWRLLPLDAPPEDGPDEGGGDEEADGNGEDDGGNGDETRTPR